MRTIFLSAFLIFPICFSSIIPRGRKPIFSNSILGFGGQNTGLLPSYYDERTQNKIVSEMMESNQLMVGAFSDIMNLENNPENPFLDFEGNHTNYYIIICAIKKLIPIFHGDENVKSSLEQIEIDLEKNKKNIFCRMSYTDCNLRENFLSTIQIISKIVLLNIFNPFFRM
jgi:hypothetical protein